jgi:integral membrane sensor domain MASE1
VKPEGPTCPERTPEPIATDASVPDADPDATLAATAAGPVEAQTRLGSPLALMLAVAGAYAVGAAAAWLLFHAASTAVFFPPAGVTLAALLLTERRRWGWVLLAAGLTEFTINVVQGQSPWVGLGFALANTAEPLVGAALVRRWRPRRLDLTARSDAAVFLVGAVLAAPLVGATIGATTIALGLGRSWTGGFGPFWAGDALAVLTLGAAGVGAAQEWPARFDPARMPRLLGRVLPVLAGTAALTVAGFWSQAVPLTFLPIPLLLVVALQGDVAAVAGAGFVMAFTANVVSGAGRGPYGALASQAEPAAAILQLHLAVAVLGAWLVAVEISARSRAEASSRREYQARMRLQVLQDVTAGLSAAVNSEQIARVLTDDGLAMVADFGVVGLIDAPDGVVRTWTTANFPAEVSAMLARIPLDEAPSIPIAQSAVNGDTVVLPSRDEIAARYPRVVWTHEVTGTRSLIAVPVTSGRRPLGALAFGFATEGAPEPDLVSLAHTLAEAAGQAWERARLYEAEYTASHQLQRSLLPSIPAELPGIEIAVHYQPAVTQHDVGGDWYDAFELPGNRVGLVVGDVVGHDLRAAVVMGQLQIRLRALAATCPDPGAVLDALGQVASTVPGAHFVTVGFADYDPATATLRYSCAGHPPPLLVSSGRCAYLWEARSAPLPIARGSRPYAAVTVPPESTLIWYSDGLIERRRRDLDVGLDRLSELAAGLAAADPPADVETWCRHIVDAMLADDVLNDDVIVACVRMHADADRPGSPVSADPRPSATTDRPRRATR